MSPAEPSAAPLRKLPGNEAPEKEIIDALFPHLAETDRRAFCNLFNHAYDHGWADAELKNSILENICREHGIKKPPAEWEDV